MVYYNKYGMPLLKLAGGQPQFEYVCLISSSDQAVDIQCLSAHVMRWSEDTWILNVGSYLPYWHSMARQKGLSVQTLWSILVQKTVNPDQVLIKDNCILLSPDFIAGGGRSVWEALLVTRQMQHRHRKGLVRAHSSQVVLAKLSWEIWMGAAQEFIEFVERHRCQSFKTNKARSALKRFRDMATRLRIDRPCDVGKLPPAQIQRRYGKVVAALCAWSMDQTRNSVQVAPYHFPWIDWQFLEPPTITRYLENPLWQWDHVLDYLRKDLDKLCQIARLESHNGITALKWTLRFDEGDPKEVTIRFRNPHPLSLELGTHKTALLQFQYQFEVLEEQSIYSLSGWQISLTEQLIIPSREHDLFGNIITQNTQEAAIRQLENELPVPLFRYGLNNEWIPEKSVQSNGRTEVGDNESCLKIAARARPFFIYANPTPLSENAAYCRHRFLEICPNPWWESNCRNFERTYCKVVDGKGRAYWVFRDPSGRWYRHGLFA